MDGKRVNSYEKQVVHNRNLTLRLFRTSEEKGRGPRNQVRATPGLSRGAATCLYQCNAE